MQQSPPIQPSSPASDDQQGQLKPPVNRPPDRAHIIFVTFLSVLILSVTYLASRFNELVWLVSAITLIIAILQWLLPTFNLRTTHLQGVKNFFAQRGFAILLIILGFLMLFNLVAAFVVYNPLINSNGLTHATRMPTSVPSSPSAIAHSTVTPILTATVTPTPPATSIPPGQVVQKWTFHTGGGVVDLPTVFNGVLYVGSDDGKVYAVNTSNGHPIWAFSTGAPVESSQTVVSGVVYATSSDNNVYAIDARTGQQKWVFSTGDAVFSSPTVVNGVLYVGSDDHKVYALNTSNGQAKWIFSTGDTVRSSPTVVNGVLYVGSGDPDTNAFSDTNVYALNANTGQQEWTFPTRAPVESSPTVANGILYVGSWDYNVYALTLPASSS